MDGGDLARVVARAASVDAGAGAAQARAGWRADGDHAHAPQGRHHAVTRHGALTAAAAAARAHQPAALRAVARRRQQHAALWHARQHCQAPPWAVSELGCCVSAEARLAALGGSALPGGEIGPLAAASYSRVLERAASKVADSAALDPPRHVHIVATPFHWFICHVPRPSASTELAWDMQTLLAESQGHEQTSADWACLMNARCDNFSVVLLPVESIDFEYEGAASGVPSARGVPWVHCNLTATRTRIHDPHSG